MNFLLFGLSIPIGAGMFLYGGVMLLVSGGSEAKVTKGRHAMTGAVIGMALAFFAWTIMNVLLSTVGFKIGFKNAVADGYWYNPPACEGGGTIDGKATCNLELPTVKFPEDNEFEAEDPESQGPVGPEPTGPLTRMPKSTDGSYELRAGRGDRQYATPAMMAALQRVAAEWHRRHPTATILISDIGTQDGARVEGHKGHREGIRADIMVNNAMYDGSRGGYDRKLAQEYIQLLKDNGFTAVIFDDPELVREFRGFVRSSPSYGNHKNHFHVRYGYGKYPTL